MQPKLTYKGITYTYKVVHGKIINSIMERNLRVILEEEFKNYPGVTEEEMEEINNLVLEVDFSDIPWEDVEKEQNALFDTFG